MLAVNETLRAERDPMVVEDQVMSGSESFEAFFERKRDGLFGALVIITGNRAEAEEIAQDAFLALWERWDRVHRLDDPTGYLYRTAMNVFRKRRRRAAMAVRRMAGMAQEPGDAFGDAERKTLVAAALAGLTPRQRAALVLTDLLGFTSEESARMLGIRAVTVRVLSSQGRAVEGQDGAKRWVTTGTNSSRNGGGTPCPRIRFTSFGDGATGSGAIG